MILSELTKIGIKSKKKRLGRGYGSGKGGHTVGKGQKGQKSRGRRKFTLGFEGGQSPLYKKLPQIGGFRSIRPKRSVFVNLSDLNSFKDGDKVSPESLKKKGIVKKIPANGVKILAKGDLKKKLDLSGFSYSAGAKEKIKKTESKIND